MEIAEFYNLQDAEKMLLECNNLMNFSNTTQKITDLYQNEVKNVYFVKCDDLKDQNNVNTKINDIDLIVQNYTSLGKCLILKKTDEELINEGYFEDQKTLLNNE